MLFSPRDDGLVLAKERARGEKARQQNERKTKRLRELNVHAHGSQPCVGDSFGGRKGRINDTPHVIIVC